VCLFVLRKWRGILWGRVTVVALASMARMLAVEGERRMAGGHPGLVLMLMLMLMPMLMRQGGGETGFLVGSKRLCGKPMRLGRSEMQRKTGRVD